MQDLKHLREVLTDAYPREELSLDALARVVAALDGLPAAALDGGWTFKGFTAWAQALESDAKRYRWLREQHTYDGEGDSDMARWYVQAGREPVPCDPGALDDNIDAAMAARGVGAA